MPGKPESRNSLAAKIKLVEDAPASTFSELAKIAGLDPAKDFRHMDYRHVDFSRSDLSGFDFTGSLIEGANFYDASVSRAIFDASNAASVELASSKDFALLLDKLLKERKVDISKRRHYGAAIVRALSYLGRLNEIKHLQSSSTVDIDLRNIDGLTPLAFAVEEENLDSVIDILSVNRIDPNLGDKDNKTPLFLACRMGNVQIVEILLAREDIDVNASDSKAETPLMVAASGGDDVIVKLLLRRSDILINAVNSKGESALSKALNAAKNHMGLGINPFTYTPMLHKEVVRLILADRRFYPKLELFDAIAAKQYDFIDLLVASGKFTLDNLNSEGLKISDLAKLDKKLSTILSRHGF